jgi:hypothetical protein
VFVGVAIVLALLSLVEKPRFGLMGEATRKGQGSGVRKPSRLRAWDRCRRFSPMNFEAATEFPDPGD